MRPRLYIKHGISQLDLLVWVNAHYTEKTKELGDMQ